MSDSSTEVGVPDDGAENTPAGIAPEGHDHPDANSSPPIDGGVEGGATPGAGAEEPWSAPTGVSGDDEVPPEESGR